MHMKNLDDEIFEHYKKAGRAVAHALKLAKKIVRPGSKILDIVTILEGDILDQVGPEGGFSFPANLSLDVCAAHYSPVIDDATVLPDQGLFKVDLGSHYMGYVADAAITVNLGKTKGIHETLIKATDDAIHAVIKKFKPGVSVRQIGAIIEKEINKYPGCFPVSNLGGHQLKLWSLHAGTFVPNISNTHDEYILKEGDQFAVEPFATNGYGAIKNGPEMTIYHYHGAPKKKNLPMKDRLLLQKFKNKFRSFPFTPRWIDFMPKADIEATLAKYLKRGFITGYNTFIERGNGIVSQSEHTLIVTEDGGFPTTWHDDFAYWD